MSRIAKLSLTVLVAAIIATGCSSATVAATVDGTGIDDADVHALAGQTDDSAVSVDAEVFRSTLALLVIQQAMVQAAQDDYGIDDLSTDAGREAYLATASPNEVDAIATEVQAAVAQGRDQSAVEDYVVTQVALARTVRDAIAADDEFLEDVWANEPDVLVGVCASHILVETEAEADAVVDRLAAGEVFEDVAADVSLDTQSPGGALPCPTPAVTFVPEFAEVVLETPVGEVSAPVETQFGFHVVRVDERIEPQSIEDLKADPTLYLPPQLVSSQFTIWLNDSLSSADIVVRSQVGTWSSQSDAILPPPASP